MKVIRTTVVKPRSGSEREVACLLKELGSFLASQPGFIESFELAADEADGVHARIGVWASKEDADRAANQVHTIAIRARLHSLSQRSDERLLGVVSERRARETVGV
ncbi:MAG: hypothetical protein HY261_04605 [Chloroflexi bacterium]|nr:hypothetical protein [Chloroflexota bacterium]